MRWCLYGNSSWNTQKHKHIIPLNTTSIWITLVCRLNDCKSVQNVNKREMPATQDAIFCSAVKFLNKIMTYGLFSKNMKKKKIAIRCSNLMQPNMSKFKARCAAHIPNEYTLNNNNNKKKTTPAPLPTTTTTTTSHYFYMCMRLR